MREETLKMTPRNWINLAVVCVAAVMVGATERGFSLSDLGLDAGQTRSAAIAFVVGAFFPGSPVGRLLDFAASWFGGPPAPPLTSDDFDQMFRRRSGPIIPPPSGAPARAYPYGPTLHAVALVFLSGALAVGGASLLMHGCGSSQLRTQGVIADTSGAALDTACQELDARRSRDLVEAAEHEDPALGVDAIAHVRAHYAPAAAACNLIADAHDAWVAELQRAEDASERGEPYQIDASIGLLVLSSWPDVAALLASNGVQLGEPDPELQALAMRTWAATGEPDGGAQ